MNRVKRTPRYVRFAAILAFMLLFASAYALLQPSEGAFAGAEIVGNPDGSTTRALIGRNDGSVQRIVYVAQAAYTMADTTPVAGVPQCAPGFTLHKAQVVVVGTLSGTNPTLAVKWQNSIDGGVTWTDVGTWVTVNATVTPGTQSQTVADVYNASTATAYGDCWRATYTFGGTGTVTANLGIVGYEK